MFLLCPIKGCNIWRASRGHTQHFWACISPWGLNVLHLLYKTTKRKAIWKLGRRCHLIRHRWGCNYFESVICTNIFQHLQFTFDFISNLQSGPNINKINFSLSSSHLGFAMCHLHHDAPNYGITLFLHLCWFLLQNNEISKWLCADESWTRQ